MSEKPPPGDDPSLAPEGPAPPVPGQAAPAPGGDVGAGAPEDPEAEPVTPWTLLQFFIFPLLVVLACVGVFILFGLVSQESRSPQDYLNDIKAGGINRRWQSAHQLTRIVAQAKDDPEVQALVPELLNLFESTKHDDPRVRAYLAVTLGHLGDPRAAPVLLQALEAGPEANQVYYVWALAALKAPAAVPPLIRLLNSDRVDLAKVAAYGLGVIGDPRAVPELRAAVHHPVEDVQWNAALALANLEDAAGLPVLLELLDRAYLDRITVTVGEFDPLGARVWKGVGTEVPMEEEQKVAAMLNAIKGVRRLQAREAAPALQRLAAGDPSMQVRQAALTALEGLDVGPDAG